MTTVENTTPVPEDEWFYELNGQRKGGVSETTIISLIQSGQLSRTSNVWKQGFSDWVKLEDTPLRVHLVSNTPPPLPGKAVNNTLVWILAFAPPIGLFLEAVIAMIVHGDEDWALEAVFAGQFFYITIAVNILLSILDERQLKKAGYDTRTFKGWVWLVPVYLYQRAKNLKQRLTYFFVWIGWFIVILLSITAYESAENASAYSGSASQAPAYQTSSSQQPLTLGDVLDSCLDSWVDVYLEEVGTNALISNQQLAEWEQWCSEGRWP